MWACKLLHLCRTNTWSKSPHHTGVCEAQQLGIPYIDKLISLQSFPIRSTSDTNSQSDFLVESCGFRVCTTETDEVLTHRNFDF